MKRKVDPLTVKRLVDMGLSGAEIARKLNVSEGCISKWGKKLTVAVAGDVTFRAVRKVHDQKTSAMSRLERISKLVEGELDYIKTVMEKTDGAVRRDWQDSQLKHCAEIRKQLSLVLDISQALYNVEEAEAFRKIVLEEIGNESEELRDRILKRLHERRSTGLALGGGGLSI